MYGDRITRAMKNAIDETTRRRLIQKAYNDEHGITPTTVQRAILDMRGTVYDADYHELPMPKAAGKKERYGAKTISADLIPPDEIPRILVDLREQMLKAAEDLQFEKAAKIRDRIKTLEQMALAVG